MSTTNGNSSSNVVKIDNYINGKFVPPKNKSSSSASRVDDDDDDHHDYLDVTNPATGDCIAQVAVSTAADVDDAVKAAAVAFESWSSLTIKARAAILLKFHALLNAHADELADLICTENGKNRTEALAEIAKGNETVEYACGLADTAAGRTLQVSSQVTCQDRRIPLGVVASIVPFNFPVMVPLWTIPIALVMGNTVILKPSEKVPMTMHRVAELLTEAGLPPGCFNMVQGTRGAVEALIQHPTVQAITFVGSSPVAATVSLQCRQLFKRCTALGGAKNHLVALPPPDCDITGAAADITVSFAGCAGQRCMAASVLLLIGGDNNEQQQSELLQAVVTNASKIQAGIGPGQMGPVIDQHSYHKIVGYIQQAEADGATVLLDGRSWKSPTTGGNWIGPTILLHKSPTDKTMCEEVFGPVLSVYQCSSWQEAIDIENANPFGNAAAIYTTNGAAAEWFATKFRAAMIGCNIGIPVPREPFSFGGLYSTKSKYGDMDITGDGGMEFFSHRIKISTKWPSVGNTAATASATTGTTDRANFAGSM